MGNDKQKSSSTTVVNQTQQATPTPEERELNQLELERVRAVQPGQIQTQLLSTELINKLLAGSTDLPGFFGQLGAGITESQVTDMSQNALRDLYPQFQAQGILDSGTAAAVAGRTAGDIRRAATEYNLNNKFNLLNLAFGGQAQVQQPLLAQSQMLGSQLAGLRTISSNSTAGVSGTVSSMNPFLKSFQTSFGGSLGEGLGKSTSAGIQGAFAKCFVAKEIFGGWDKIEVMYCRFYIYFGSPKWFMCFYDKYSKDIAIFIKNKPLLKRILKPLFLLFSKLGKKMMNKPEVIKCHN